ncbi:MAG: peptidyl-prolyl cis-trans isomerase [Nanoarchaeota archaeon]|nr:peptidyl-prolyl cis-trans isomerase [Nanoarchaeota archaeon]MBU4123911.1 peptidyl-prolyl cis-trans isomerase [Nanoarchaeota archaeon]
MVTHVHACHILVKTEQEANDILKEINKGANFEKMAQLKSTCPSAKRGGDLGWFGRGQMVREFEKAAFELEKGQTTIKPVRTQFGWHLIKVVDKR